MIKMPAITRIDPARLGLKKEGTPEWLPQVIEAHNRNCDAILELAREIVPASDIAAKFSPPRWTPAGLLADFVAASGQAGAAFHRDALGYVHVRGLVETAAGQAAATAIFTLPIGCRPASPVRVAVRGTTSTAQFLTISTAGEVTCDLLIAAGGSVSLFFSFLAEQ